MLPCGSVERVCVCDINIYSDLDCDGLLLVLVSTFADNKHTFCCFQYCCAGNGKSIFPFNHFFFLVEVCSMRVACGSESKSCLLMVCFTEWRWWLHRDGSWMIDGLMRVVLGNLLLSYLIFRDINLIWMFLFFTTHNRRVGFWGNYIENYLTDRFPFRRWRGMGSYDRWYHQTNERRFHKTCGVEEGVWLRE